jgi:2-oxoglutarate ferredoxin oxidoreductase subunit alpha
MPGMTEQAKAISRWSWCPQRSPARTVWRGSAVVVRFAGDSGDGMQLTGGSSPSPPRWPATTLRPSRISRPKSARRRHAVRRVGVPDQFRLGRHRHRRRRARRADRDEPGGAEDQRPRPAPGGLLIADTGEFNERNLEKAATTRTRSRTAARQVAALAFDISALTLESVKPFGLATRKRCAARTCGRWAWRYWMFDRDREPIGAWLKQQVRQEPELAEANIAALNAGHAYGETAEIGGHPRLHGRSRAVDARALPHRHRRRGRSLGAGRGRAAAG